MKEHWPVLLLGGPICGGESRSYRHHLVVFGIEAAQRTAMEEAEGDLVRKRGDIRRETLLFHPGENNTAGKNNE